MHGININMYTVHDTVLMYFNYIEIMHLCPKHKIVPFFLLKHDVYFLSLYVIDVLFHYIFIFYANIS